MLYQIIKIFLRLMLNYGKILLIIMPSSIKYAKRSKVF